MIRDLKFYKEPTGQWYVDLPNFPGAKAELEMVAGADTLLNYYANGNDNVSFQISLTEKADFDAIIFISEDGTDTGAYYNLSRLKGNNFSFKIWLCNVTLYLFGEFPPAIYIKPIDALIE